MTAVSSRGAPGFPVVTCGHTGDLSCWLRPLQLVLPSAKHVLWQPGLSLSLTVLGHVQQLEVQAGWQVQQRGVMCRWRSPTWLLATGYYCHHGSSQGWGPVYQDKSQWQWAGHTFPRPHLRAWLHREHQRKRGLCNVMGGSAGSSALLMGSHRNCRLSAELFNALQSRPAWHWILKRELFQYSTQETPHTEAQDIILEHHLGALGENPEY